MHDASPIVVAAAVWGSVAIAIAAVGAAVARSLGAMLVDACTAVGSVADVSVGHNPKIDASAFASTIVAYAAPIVAAAAITAIVAQLAQTRALWLPRRRLDGAPAPERSRGAHVSIDLGGAAIIGAIVVGWLWMIAQRLAALFEVAPAPGAELVASFVATIAIGLVAIGAVDAIVRRFELAAGLRMTAAEKRDDVRHAGLDPRWRRRASRRDEIAEATVLVLGDGVAVAIAWDPIHRPVPTRVASGRDADATRLLGLARRDRIPVHRDPALAVELAGMGSVAEAQWPRLAEIVAAVRRG